MSRKKTIESLSEEISKLTGGKFEILQGQIYINNKSPLEIMHLGCRNSFFASPNAFLRHPKCSKCERDPSRDRISQEEFKKRVLASVGPEYEVLGNFINTKSKVLVRHLTCRTEYSPVAERIIQGDRCPSCYGVRRLTQEEFEGRVTAARGKELEVAGRYSSYDEKVLMFHPCCGRTFEMLPCQVMAGDGCPLCKKENVSGWKKKYLTDGEFLHKHGDRIPGYSFISEYEGYMKPISVRHDECGTVFKCSSPTNFLMERGKRCPVCCGPHSSRGEKELFDFVTRICTEREIIRRDRSVLKRGELDILVPDVGIAIEFNGLHWHSEEMGKGANYHLQKTEECALRGVRLIHLMEDEWRNKRRIVESRLSLALRALNVEKVSARACFVDLNVGQEEARAFLTENHIQGSGSGWLRAIGLRLEGTLVSLATFCAPRRALGMRKGNDGLELSRFCSLIGVSVRGGLGRLVSSAEKELGARRIISYADRRWSDGASYLKCGFRLDHYSLPNYWYCRNDSVRLHRYGFRKGTLAVRFPNLYNESKTEKEIMKEAGYSRIWDCGCAVLVRE